MFSRVVAGKNAFYEKKGQDGLSTFAWGFLNRILANANDICLILNSSVNSYRRLDPHFEAPNQIKASAINRGAMVRIPLANEKSARVEVRSVGPDANPYMVLYSVFKTGLDGDTAKIKNLRQADRYLPDNVYTALENLDLLLHGGTADQQGLAQFRIFTISIKTFRCLRRQPSRSARTSWRRR